MTHDTQQGFFNPYMEVNRVMKLNKKNNNLAAQLQTLQGQSVWNRVLLTAFFDFIKKKWAKIILSVYISKV